MSAKTKPICVFCFKKNEPLHLFTPSFLEKCQTILDIRKNNNLSMKDAKVPVDVSDKQKYHSKCYKLFTALPKKYRCVFEPSSHESSLQEDTESNDHHIIVVDINTPDNAERINVGASTSRQPDANVCIVLDNFCNTAEKSSVSDDPGKEECIQSTTDETADPEDTNGQDIVCIFCNKKRKKMNGNEQVLRTCVIPEKIDVLKNLASEMNDTDLFNKIDAKCANNAIIYYHKCCKLNYKNTLQSMLKSSSTEQTSWHASRSLHRKAFDAVCSYVSTHVIHNNRCVYLSFLKSLFMEFTTNHATELINMKPYNLENRLLEKFHKKINIITLDYQKIVKPYRGNLLKNDLDMLKQQDILDRAAQILRSEIQSIQHNQLPNEPATHDLIKGECDVPPMLTDFYSKIICSSFRRKGNINVSRISKSYAEDLIYATSHGKIKPSKHISLGMALKGLTNSKKIINILNKFGHCCSYTVLEEIETEATFASTNRNDICPEGILRSNRLCTGLAYDNFDRFVDTTSGKDTLHDTVGIIFQNVSNSDDESESEAESSHTESSVFEDSNGSNQPQPAGSKRRRRTFDAVTFELEAYNKKPKIHEILQPIDSPLRLYDSSKMQAFKRIDLAWVISHFLKVPHTPAWVGFQSMIQHDTRTSYKQKIAYLTTINSSPTNTSVVLETMRQGQQVARECNETYMEITYDLAIAKIALQIQSSDKPRFDNLFIHFGSFHIMMAYFKAIGKFIDSCGITNVMINAEVLASGSVNTFITGQHFNRCKRLHPLLSLALQSIHFEKFLSTKTIEITDEIRQYLITFKSENSTDPINNDKLIEILEKYERYQKRTLEGKHGKTAQFYMIYVNLMNYYFLLCKSIRKPDFELFKFILPKITNMFFVFNQQNYSRYTVLYHDKLMNVATSHPGLELRFEKGSYGIKRTDKPFSRQPVDLTLEQTINADAANKLTGIINSSNSISARQRWCKSHSIRTAVISHIMEQAGLQKSQDVTADLDNNRIKKHSIQLENLISHLKQNNPFSDNYDKNFLFNISTGQAIGEDISEFLLNIEARGNELREKFITECTTDPHRFERTIPRTKVLTFANAVPKKKLAISGKLVEVRMQRDLFAQLLIISLEKTLNLDAVLTYPLTPAPLALCHLDGAICKTNKSALLKIVEKQVVSSPPAWCDVMIYDGFFLLHSMTEVPLSFGNISKKLITMVTSSDARKIIIAFDRYFVPSIKDHEHTLRGRTEGQNYHIHSSDQLRTANFSHELKNTYFKEALIQFICQDWKNDYMAPFIGERKIYINHDVCYKYEKQNEKIERSVEQDLNCTAHEEADTKIIFHICQLNTDVNVVIRCSDTDILMILLGNMNHIQSNLKIHLLLGTGNAQRYIDVTQLYETLGPSLCASLPGFHAFTGCDFNPAFYRRGKKKPFEILRQSESFIKVFTDIANIDDSNIHQIQKNIEEFVCRMYGLKSIGNVNTARVATFMKAYKMNDQKDKFTLKHTIDGAIFPPCQSELYQHILRTAYIAHLWSHAHRSVPSVSSPLHYGWKEENNKYTFKWFDGDQVPPSVTGITIIDENPAENDESDVETSENMEEDDAEELEEERNLIIYSSDDSSEESDGNDTDTAEDA